jgi:hypothetical protein
MSALVKFHHEKVEIAIGPFCGRKMELSGVLEWPSETWTPMVLSTHRSHLLSSALSLSFLHNVPSSPPFYSLHTD